MEPETDRVKRINRWKTIERIVLLPLLLVVVMAFFLIGRVEVLGQSMLPTYVDGKRLLVLKKPSWAGGLHVGDVVVIEAAHVRGRDAQVIKRIVFIQNAEGSLPWPETLPTTRGQLRTVDLFGDDILSRPVPKNGMIVLGDNITNSTDSRDFGPVFAHELYGKVIGN